MKNIRPTPVDQLRPYTKANKIKELFQKYNALHCILVDEAQHPVEGCTYFDVMASKIEAGGCYEITEFQTIRIRRQYRELPHETQVLFSSKIVFQKLTTIFPLIPRHRFFLVIQPLEPKQINQRIAYKCDVRIENIRKEQLMVTLSANVAEDFSSLSTDMFSLRLHKSESEALLGTFESAPPPPPLSSPQANETAILETGRRVTIDELAFLDPELHKRFDTRFDWWYNACPNYVKQMHKDLTTGQLICQKHPNQIPTPWYKVNLILEDETNNINALIISKCGEKLFGMACKDLVMNQRLVEQRQLRNEFLRLIGQQKIFHLQFGNRRNAFNSDDVLIQNVTEDMTMQPITPQPLSREITVSSTVVSSSTSTAETTKHSYKWKRELIRRALFTAVEWRKFQTDPREMDEVPIKLLKKKSSPTGGKLDATPSKTT
ncbi:hypothetical protein D8674_041050 [Pyrus ussuriensis x Pyrus communis]|uniref:Uncharacterized protein n=1 Tax=Pyrus ussuriensis x Pyrus communis TaxID=2448454 RepID=A0A5N5FCR0_9ROSA|nr:hypothetical protein D8674_041050 [Pyrus ussuriensis x Pyrus communis]